MPAVIRSSYWHWITLIDGFVLAESKEIEESKTVDCVLQIENMRWEVADYSSLRSPGRSSGPVNISIFPSLLRGHLSLGRSQ